MVAHSLVDIIDRANVVRIGRQKFYRSFLIQNERYFRSRRIFFTF